MKTIGFLISHKNGECRRAVLPTDLCNVKYTDQLYFEIGYGELIGYSDEEYIKYGCHIVDIATFVSYGILPQYLKACIIAASPAISLLR